MGGLEVAHLNDHAAGLADVNKTEEQQQLRAAHAEGQRRYRAAQVHAARVAHEHLGRVEVPQQKACTAAGHGGGVHRQMEVVQHTGRDDVSQHHHKGHAAGQAVNAVGQVHRVHHKDDQQEGDGIEQDAQIHKAHNGQHHGAGQNAVQMQAVHKQQGDGHLQHDLLHDLQAQISLLDHLDVIVHKAHQAEQPGRAQRQNHVKRLVAAHQVALLHAQIQPGQAQTQRAAENKADAAHGRGSLLVFMPGGADLFDGLPVMQLVQKRHHDQA